MRLFTLPIVSNAAREIRDFNPDTFSTTLAQTITLVASGSVAYDAIYTITSGATGYSLDTPSTTISIPASAVRGDKAYYLHLFSSSNTDNQIVLTFTGTNVRIYQVWVMKSLFSVNDDRTRADVSLQSRGAIRQSANKRNNYIPPLGGLIDGWTARGSTEFYANAAERALADTFIHIIRGNKPLIMAHNSIDQPDVVFRANADIQSVAYMGRQRASGKRVRWLASEV